MAQRAQGLSITLPRNFAYHPSDGPLPRTPDQTFAEVSLPPPPHHSTCRFRRPRLDAMTASATHDGTLPFLLASDIPIPSIEVAPSSQSPQREWSRSVAEPSPSDRFRLSAYRDYQPPRTPPAQMPLTPTEARPNGGWDLQRPDSSCSFRSDSSVSSNESFGTRPSFGGSCTSPESDAQDPFSSRASQYMESPLKPGRKRAISHSETVLGKVRWTPEMDSHLWNIYQMYLQDPTITPFKTMPGSLPPLGVCHRVAREAKKTWSRATKAANDERRIEQPAFINAYQDDTPELESPRSGSSTPTATGQEFPRVFWPRESSTRRRLKELCKRKFSIAPHYQRLLQSRSPSPFLDQFVHRRATSRSSTLPTDDSSSVTFATRDLGISLMSSESARGPLAQLASQTSPPQSDPDDWFNSPIGTEKSMEMSVSPQRHLGINHLAPPSSIPRLASPFSYNTWGPTRSRRNQRPALNQYDTMHATGPHLMSPVRLDPFSNAHKRRAQHQLEDELSPGGSDLRANLQNLFPAGSGDMSSRRVRLRNRGFTLGAVGGREALDTLFNPPPSNDTVMTGLPVSSDTASGLAPPVNEDAKRLGSPFELDAKRSFRSRSPRHAASTSESSITNPFASQLAVPSIGERLAAFDSVQQKSTQPLDAMEPGISDADRIRRQLINRQNGHF